MTKINLTTTFLGMFEPVEITSKEFIDQCRKECAPVMKPGTKRQDALNLIRYHGYHNNTGGMIETRIKHRIGAKVAMEAFRAGGRAKAKGIPCSCYSCRKERGEV